MNEKFICCEECFNILREKSSQCVNLWKTLCQFHLKGEVILCFLPELPEFRILEQMGYIVSTETDTSLAVKVNGCFFSEEGEPCFCIKGGNHGTV
jgi:hypothetical protein